MSPPSDRAMQARRALRIAHVSADFPDSIAARKTPVIRRLLELAPEPLRHQVWSLNRVSPGIGAMIRGALGGWGHDICAYRETFGHAVTYTAPGKGVCHVSALEALGDWLAERMAQDNPPDLLFAHKLTIEGLAVRHAAARLGLPYAITIQGNTDLKILAARPDLRGRIAKVYHDAAQVISFAPWSLGAVEQMLGARKCPGKAIPCPPDFDDIIAPDPAGTGLLSVFHLHNARGKNLGRMVRAMAQIAPQHPEVNLQIAGVGTEAETAACRKMIAGHRQIALTGQMTRGEVRRAMNGAAGFVLPSLRESFGLVFMEALLSGLPIIYPKGAAVDGYFNGCPFAIAVDARDVNDVAAAMAFVLRHSAQLKKALAQWQQSEDAQKFLPPAIGKTFCGVIREAAVAC